MGIKLKKLLKLKIANILLLSLYNNITLADITVMGRGIVETPPNQASFDVSVETNAKTGKEAAVANAKQTDKVVQLLKGLLKDPKAVTTHDYQAYPDYQYNESTKKSELIGFKVTNQVLVKTSNLDSVGNLLDQVSNAGVTTINNLQFSYDKPKEIQRQSLAKAMEDAIAQAKVLAEAGGVKINGIKIIDSVNLSTEQPYPRPMMTMADAMSAKMAPATPVSPADLKTQTQVMVVFLTN